MKQTYPRPSEAEVSPTSVARLALQMHSISHLQFTSGLPEALKGAIIKYNPTRHNWAFKTGLAGHIPIFFF